jgi:hypothetical protein
MSKQITAIALERATEQLRQEREIFEQRRKHEAKWFSLRLCMGYSSIVLLGTVMVVAICILLFHKGFPNTVVASAGAALFADILGLLIGVWKIALNPNFISQAQPVTTSTLAEISGTLKHLKNAPEAP